MPERRIRPYGVVATLIWLMLMAALIHAGTQPDYWMQRGLEPGAILPYPTGKVVTFALMCTVELTATLLIVRPWQWRRLWLRLLIALALLMAWSTVVAMGAMHQSPVYGTHLLWLLLADLALLLALLAVSLATAWQNYRRT